MRFNGEDSFFFREERIKIDFGFGWTFQLALELALFANVGGVKLSNLFDQLISVLIVNVKLLLEGLARVRFHFVNAPFYLYLQLSQFLL